MAEKNSTIMASVWLEATNDFQQRIPNPTTQGLDATLGALFDPLNNDMWNYFVNALVMRIGMVRVRNQEFKNLLREFKGACCPSVTPSRRLRPSGLRRTPIPSLLPCLT